MNVEDERIRQPAHVVEARLGAGPRDPRLAGLPRRADHPGDEREERQRGGADRRTMAPDELGGPIVPGVPPRQHGKPFEVPPHVFRELIDRGVAARRLLAQRLEDDGIEVAGEPPAQTLRLDRAQLAGGDLTRRHRLRAGDRLRCVRTVGRVRDSGAGARRHRLADHPRHVDRRPARDAIGPPAGEQLVEQYAERVDVGRGRHRIAANLLGAGVLRRHQLHAGHRRRVGVARHLRVQELRNPEVEELRRSVHRHEHVGRLEVAVDDQVLVRVLDGGADLPEDREPRRRVEAARFAVVHELAAVHVLHGEVRKAVARRAAVEQPRDVRMRQAGEDLPLVAEPRRDGVGVHPSLEDLDRDPLLVGGVGAYREIDRTHPAVADLADQAVWPDARVAPEIVAGGAHTRAVLCGEAHEA